MIELIAASAAVVVALVALLALRCQPTEAALRDTHECGLVIRERRGETVIAADEVDRIFLSYSELGPEAFLVTARDHRQAVVPVDRLSSDTAASLARFIAAAQAHGASVARGLPAVLDSYARPPGPIRNGRSRHPRSSP